jgi:lipopolysaccharide biosynthesis glycosyltransferase
MKKNLLVTLADENYIEQAKQLFSSVYWNAGWEGDYLLLAHEVPEEKTAWFKKKGILVYPVTSITEKQIGGDNHPVTVFSKLYLFAEHFKQWEKVVFLDADIIVRASLDSLIHVDFFSAPNASSLNLKKEFIRTQSTLFRELAREYPLKGSAFNTGVFAFDTDLIDQDSFSTLNDLIRRFGSLNRYGEEATLNLFFYKKWKMLPIVYNIYPDRTRHLCGVLPSHLRGIIVHFVVSCKPWKSESPFYAEWFHNYEKADMIDLSQRQKPVAIWKQRDIENYTLYLRVRYLARFFSRCTEKLLGEIGLLVKKMSPRLYDRVRFKHHDAPGEKIQEV